MEFDKEKIGKRIRDWRLKQGLTQEQLGGLFEDKELGENKANKGIVSAWERGDSVPSPYRLRKLSDLIGIPMEELAYGNIEEYIYSVINDDINNGGRLFRSAVEYLTNTTDLYDVEGALFLDDDGNFINIDKAAETEFEIKQGAVRELIRDKISDLIPLIKSQLNGSYNRDVIIDVAINLIGSMHLTDMYSFEGQYFSIRKALNNTLPSYLGAGSINDLTKINKERDGLTENQAYRKAVDQFYQNKFFELRVEFTKDMEELYSDYKNDLEKCTN